jgi:hypothetical protein
MLPSLGLSSSIGTADDADANYDVVDDDDDEDEDDEEDDDDDDDNT